MYSYTSLCICKFLYHIYPYLNIQTFSPNLNHGFREANSLGPPPRRHSTPWALTRPAPFSCDFHGETNASM